MDEVREQRIRVVARRRNSEDPVHGPRLIARESVMSERIPLLSKLSVILTDKCNITCRHCMPECTPYKNRTLEWPQLKEIIDTAASVEGMKTICFTGGEVFMFPKLLALCVARVAEHRLESTAISNAFWAKSVEKAVKCLRDLPGLTRLGLSTDSFHQEFIGIDRIKNGIIACHELGIECAVRICHLDNPDEEIEAVRAQLVDVRGMYDIEHQPVQPIGRAEFEVDAEHIFSYDTNMAVCRSADVHAVNPSGRLTACCGGTGDWPFDHPLEFGDVTTDGLDAALERAANSFALHAVRLWGPAGLLKLAQAEARLEGKVLEDPGINNICGLCKFVVADADRAKLLTGALARPEVQKKIALARLIELGEGGSLLRLEEGAEA